MRNSPSLPVTATHFPLELLLFRATENTSPWPLSSECEKYISGIPFVSINFQNKMGYFWGIQKYPKFVVSILRSFMCSGSRFSRLRSSSCCHLRLQRILFRILQIVDFQIYIQVLPIQVIAMQELHTLDGTQRLILEIRIDLVTEKILSPLYQQPDPEGSNVLNACRSAPATL